MSVLVAAVLWAGAGVGVVVLWAGSRGRVLFSASELGMQAGRGPGGRAIQTWMISAVAVAAAIVLTRSMAAGLLAALAIWALPRLRSRKGTQDAAVAVTEAIAAWTEMLRDSIIAAAGLEEAIMATGPIAPEPIAREVRALVRRLDVASGQPLSEALRAFGDEMHHPSADLVVAALVIASQMQVSDLSGLLSRLADAIRDDARMRIRVEVGRTRVRTAANVIMGVVVATTALLAITNLDYLSVYNEPGGQLALLVIGGLFAAGAWSLDRMAELDLPERFTARSTREVQPWS